MNVELLDESQMKMWYTPFSDSAEEGLYNIAKVL
jgi:hypothetical protein